MYPVEIKSHYAPWYLPGEAGQEGDDAVQARPCVTRTHRGADTAPSLVKHIIFKPKFFKLTRTNTQKVFGC